MSTCQRGFVLVRPKRHESNAMDGGPHHGTNRLQGGHTVTGSTQHQQMFWVQAAASFIHRHPELACESDEDVSWDKWEGVVVKIEVSVGPAAPGVVNAQVTMRSVTPDGLSQVTAPYTL